ncbi:DUF952 domain-containing protein [Bacillus pseudomycoides]|uniref:DUF952 domain-containing protein n=1 Tax=Bacillus TaxID=1386 RepID=UPI0001A14E11|nr:MULTISPECIES: DUF952 domain-containing protein [Bacillus]AIK40511.1 hypothetical protein DJ92_5262 [Bacillus pseudomycoides]AJI19119.1 hypothetical protein BG07_5046 [Bacillus pseudomycoides]EEM16744.1 hypothetical protein bpmyx0001_23700 [Bacillus pseudomycoides DSM 12442]MBJ8028975.1 DUF952 domain-containing protein [Bacillus cereus group sp. N21]MEB3053012.1 DUF952 domain-containing protein [Bacillus pseudomycoides]
MITKVMEKSEWEVAKAKGNIMEPSLMQEGFIHCSFLEQSLQVAEKHFSTEMELVLLVINPSLVEAEIKYELASNGQNYPHIYGTVNANAVVKVVELQKENGGYVLPVELEQK